MGSRGTAPDTQPSTSDPVLHWADVHIYRGCRVILQKAATALPPAAPLRSAGHGCGEGDGVPGKHRCRCPAQSLRPPGHDGWRPHPAPRSPPFFACVHPCESGTRPTGSRRRCASGSVAGPESAWRRTAAPQAAPGARGPAASPVSPRAPAQPGKAGPHRDTGAPEPQRWHQPLASTITAF